MTNPKIAKVRSVGLPIRRVRCPRLHRLEVVFSIFGLAAMISPATNLKNCKGPFSWLAHLVTVLRLHRLERVLSRFGNVAMISLVNGFSWLALLCSQIAQVKKCVFLDLD